MRYSPFASVVTDLTFSISAGLLASTVTPGSTAPVASFTTPAKALCARAVAGSARHPSATTNNIAIRLLVMPNPPQSTGPTEIQLGRRIWRIPLGIHREIAIGDAIGETNSRNWIPTGRAAVVWLDTAEFAGGTAQRCPPWRPQPQ